MTPSVRFGWKANQAQYGDIKQAVAAVDAQRGLVVTADATWMVPKENLTLVRKHAKWAWLDNIYNTCFNLLDQVLFIRRGFAALKGGRYFGTDGDIAEKASVCIRHQYADDTTYQAALTVFQNEATFLQARKAAHEKLAQMQGQNNPSTAPMGSSDGVPSAADPLADMGAATGKDGSTGEEETLTLGEQLHRLSTKEIIAADAPNRTILIRRWIGPHWLKDLKIPYPSEAHLST
jgi:hypothetical protein